MPLMEGTQMHRLVTAPVQVAAIFWYMVHVMEDDAVSVMLHDSIAVANVHHDGFVEGVWQVLLHHQDGVVHLLPL